MNRLPQKSTPTNWPLFQYLHTPVTWHDSASRKSPGEWDLARCQLGVSKSVFPGHNQENTLPISFIQLQEALWESTSGSRPAQWDPMAGQVGGRAGAWHPTALQCCWQPLAGLSWAPGPRVGGSGMEAEAGEGRAGIQRQCLSKSHSPSQLCSAARCFLVNIYRDYVSLLRASKRACAIILRTDWECKPNIFFSSLSKSDDQLWLQSCQILSNIAQNYTEP